MQRYIGGVFLDDSEMTIGVDFYLKVVTIDGIKVKFQVWDTAGAERFRSLTRSYFRCAQGVVFVYDITHKYTFEGLSEWLSMCDEYAPEDMCKVVVGNKCDLEERREVSREDGEKCAKKIGASFFETSAKTGEGVDAPFEELTRQMIKRHFEVLEEDKPGDCII